MKVLILMGSDSDMPVMSESSELLKDFGVQFDMTIASAHRSPQRSTSIAQSAQKNGYGVIIAAAGMAAHLAGVVASHTALPVIGVPLDSSPLGGMDALLSTVQMPPGVPVAAVSIGKAGAKNAALLAVRILALNDKALKRKLDAYNRKLAHDVEQKALKIKKSDK